MVAGESHTYHQNRQRELLASGWARNGANPTDINEHPSLFSGSCNHLAHVSLAIRALARSLRFGKALETLSSAIFTMTPIPTFCCGFHCFLWLFSNVAAAHWESLKNRAGLVGAALSLFSISPSAELSIKKGKEKHQKDKEI